MAHVISFTIVILSAIVAAITKFAWPLMYFEPVTLDQHRDIVNFGAFKRNGRTTLSRCLKIRAVPNYRLSKAFGLVNSFTTTDRKIHTDFLKKATHVIRDVDSERWTELSQLAESTLGSAVGHFKADSPHIPLAALVRTFSFVLALNVLFPDDPKRIELRDAQIAADAINRLWVQSKGSSKPSPEDKKALQSSLERLLPGRFPCEDRKHPINLIVPAFETLWRAVLLTFVAATSGELDKEAALQLSDAAANVPGEEETMLAFAKEGLRLYPPTKRIYRAVPDRHWFDWLWGGRVVAADVESCHRNPDIWGGDALRFRPGRFRSSSLTPAMEQAYMPFGLGMHKCPAASGFGERMIAILLMALVRRFGVDAAAGLVRINEKAGLQQSSGDPLPSCRLDMEAWTIRVRSVDHLE